MTQFNRWQGAEPTPSWIGIDTPFHYLNDSWNVALRLVDKGRRLYREGHGMGRVPDNPKGYPGAWTPVSLGRCGPQVYPWDARDIRHAAKLMAYLWAEEPGLLEEYERNCFIEHVAKNGDFLNRMNDTPPYSGILGMFVASTGDLAWCYGVTPAKQKQVLGNVIKLIKRALQTFDPEGSGLLNVGVGKKWHARGFWGTFLGEPNHMPANYDGTNKIVIAGMALAVFAKRFRDAARELDAPEADDLNELFERLTAAIEGPAWNEMTQYYYLQRDDNSARWFHSINGQCEDSRETDVVPFYAAEACEIPERVNAVGRVLCRALLKDRIFPMPTHYPVYSWYSPAHPNGVDMGEDCGQIGGAWDTPYFHCVELLARLGLQEAVQRAILRRAEAVHRDQDCMESFRLDGTVDNARFCNRDEYIVSATAHLSAIIEGLFGITPAKTGFAEVNIRPNLPFYRKHRHTVNPSQWSGRDNAIGVNLGPGKQLHLKVRYDEDTERLSLKTNQAGITAHIRLPLDLGARFLRATWNGKPVKARVEKGLDSDFIYVDHKLDGGELLIRLKPHPQKGKGTTPEINPRTC